MTGATIRSFRVAEWSLYRALRLRALRDSPDAFSTTYSDALSRTDADWRDRLAQMSTRYDLALVAELQGNAVGLVWVRIDPSTPDVAHLYQMWVAAECRGRGVGKALLDTAIEWTTSNGARSIELGVTVGNSPARRLYKGAGFRAIGVPEPLRPDSDLEVQNMLLSLPLRA
jgi:ribosomal protein S18 acetylase RimI-like enzyme